MLLISNIITIYLALTRGWGVFSLMLIYWFQSVIIGVFNFIRILQLKDFSTEGFTINDVPAKPTFGTKIFTAIFFAFHYGFFHLGYLIAIWSFNENGFSQGELVSILSVAVMFFVSHLVSYLFYRPKDGKKQNIGHLMSYIYARIVPMHLTIMFGFIFNGLILFLILKTVADLVMHIIEHRIFRKD